MKISAYSESQAQLCVMRFPSVFTSPGWSLVPVTGSYHWMSNCPAGPAMVTVLGLALAPFTRTTTPRSGEWLSVNHLGSPVAPPSRVAWNGAVAEGMGLNSGVMSRANELLAVQTTPRTSTSRASTQSRLTEVPLVASAAFTYAAPACSGPADGPISSFRTIGLFSARSAIQAASACQSEPNTVPSQSE